MFRKSVAAAVLVAGAAFLPSAAAQAATAFTTGSAEMRAGPDYDYPVVRVIRDDRAVEVFGCLNDWSFCDVGYHSDRGWVAGDDLAVDYRSRRWSIVEGGPYIGLGFVTFSFGSYWDNYYRGRPFYHDRARWERHYHDHYQAHWGPRPGNWRGNDRHDNDRRGDRWNDRDRHDNDRHDNDRHDNRPSYQGKPGNPPAAAPTPQPRPGIVERPDNVRENRASQDRPRGNDHLRNDRPATAPPAVTPRPTPAPTPGAMGEHRGPQQTGNERHDSNRPGGDRMGGGDHHERPMPKPSQQRNDKGPKPPQKPAAPNDQDDRPGR
jgi:uncharacterized protein YraI